MRTRFLAFVLLFALGCVGLGLFLQYSNREDSLSLAELTSSDQRNIRAEQLFRNAAQSMRDGGTWMANIDTDLIFYAALAVCAILLALRAIVSAIRVARAERLTKTREPAGRSLAVTGPAREVRSSSRFAGAEETAAEISVNRRSDLSLDKSKTPAAPSFLGEARTYLGSFSRGLGGKMILTFTGIIAAFGLLTVGVVYFKLSAALTGQAIQRARILSANVRDSAPAFLLKKDAKGMRELLRKVASRPGVAYVFVEDRTGNIFAHSFAVLPQEIQNAERSGSARNDKPRTLRLGEEQVYEVSMPVLEGQIGAVRVALWKGDVDREISMTVIPLIKLIGLIVLAGIALAIFLVWRITHPILRLVRTARRISQGELDAPSLGVTDSTEFGELSRALERMRSSVKAALVRLREER
jgi:HAMP domain-containing protein